MHYASELLEGVLLQRRVRFLADILLDDGREVTAHCVNSGSMRGVIRPGQRVRISRAANPKRKLKWTWEHAKVGRTWVGVNTALPNPAVGEALENGRIERLTDWPVVRREVKFGRENSRVDFMLEGDGLPTYALEVKNVSMAEGRRAVFPDSVTERGRKHLRELAAEVRAGRRGGVLFFVHRSDCDVMIPADAIDPAYGKALRWAARNGVEVMAHRALVSPAGVRLGPPLEVDLSPGLRGGASWL
ncbi:MAG: DNA/RNA nuclease SfsA [Planctomycetota bacterium]|jgi:sugar fermentation stimulation protein A